MVVLAQDEARALRHNYIRTEHFLLGLLREQEGLAARVLGSFGITLDEVQAQVVRIVGQGDEAVTDQIPFTKHAIDVLNLAQREALSLGNNFIGTEHILLSLVAEREGRAAEILGGFDAGAERIREEVIRVIGGPGPVRRMRAFRQGWSQPSNWGCVGSCLSHSRCPTEPGRQRRGLGSRPGRPVGCVRTSAAIAADRPAHLDWLVSDDVGTTYSGWGGGGGGNPERGFHYSVEFEPAPPPEATSLLIRHEPTDEELSVSLTE